jgi:hypothetical protein
MQKIIALCFGFLLLGGGVAFAQTGTIPVLSNDEGIAPVPTLISVNPNMLCVQTAVATREAAIGTAFTTFSTSMSSALSTRATALNTAWGMTDAKARRTARNEAWVNYKKASQAAKSTMKTSKKSAWTTFQTASKACKTAVVEFESNDNLAI